MSNNKDDFVDWDGDYDRKNFGSTIPQQEVKTNSVWKHTNGNLYIVLVIANEKADESRIQQYPVTVVYGGENGNVWSRPLTEWHRSMSYVGDNG